MLAGIQGAMVASRWHGAEQITHSCRRYLKSCYPLGKGASKGSWCSARSFFPSSEKNCPSFSRFVFSLNQDCTLGSASSTPRTCKCSCFLWNTYSGTEKSTSSGQVAPKVCTTTVQLQYSFLDSSHSHPEHSSVQHFLQRKGLNHSLFFIQMRPLQ